MPETPLKLGDYLILEKIAHGGMAQIYKAKTADPKGIERLVVIKRILPHISSNPEYVEMLIDEAKIAVHFSHGNIAQIYDLGRIADDYFIVMEYVDGKTLGQIIREFKERGDSLPLDFIVYSLAEICAGLDYMHRKSGEGGNSLGVVHRDISPQNIIVSYSGTVKIIDFGVAKSLDKLSQTESGVLKGKFAYMSPEQAEGDQIDRRSDIFSAGILLWELLTAQRLFKRKTNPETVKAVRKATVAPPSKFRSDLPRTLDKIAFKALEKKRGARYQWASEMAADLTRLLYELNPDFRPLHITQLLYRAFGPEADEAALPAELPELDVSPAPLKQMKNPDDEKTVLDRHWGIFWKGVAWGALTFALFGFMVAWAYFGFRSKLLITVGPGDSRVIVNGERPGRKGREWVASRWLGGAFDVQIAREGFEPFFSTEILKGGETRKLEIQLKKFPKELPEPVL